MYRLGWIPDVPDKRDLKRSLLRPRFAPLPRHVDLRPYFPPVYDQGQLGSCTGNGVAGALQYERRRQKLSDYTPSRLFIYYNERVIEGTVGQDAGAQIRDGIKAVNKHGGPPENVWPYDISKFAVKPPSVAYTDGMADCALKYLSVDQTQAAIKSALADGYPVIVGFSVYGSFETPDDLGNIPMPNVSSETLLGGHCTVVVGYNDPTQRWIIRNSWGPAWGKNGYCYMPYPYLTDPDLASDFWSIELVGKSIGIS